MERKLLGDGNVLVLFPSLAAVQDAIQLALTSPAFRLAVSAAGQTARRFFRNITLDEKMSVILNDLKTVAFRYFSRPFRKIFAPPTISCTLTL